MRLLQFASVTAILALAAPGVAQTEKQLLPTGQAITPVATACVTHDSGYWAAAMAGQNFAVEDRLDTAAINTAIWRGLGSGPEPRVRNARNLGHDQPARTKDFDAAPCASLNASIP